MSTNTAKNNGEQQTNVNRSTYAHLLAGGYDKRQRERERKSQIRTYNIHFTIVLLVHLVLY